MLVTVTKNKKAGKLARTLADVDSLFCVWEMQS